MYPKYTPASIILKLLFLTVQIHMIFSYFDSSAGNYFTKHYEATLSVSGKTGLCLSMICYYSHASVNPVHAAAVPVSVVGSSVCVCVPILVGSHWCCLWFSS